MALNQFEEKNKLKFLVITKGISGSMLFDHKLKYYSCPSFNSKPIDKIGAGDSMLSILSILLKNKFNPAIRDNNFKQKSIKNDVKY